MVQRRGRGRFIEETFPGILKRERLLRGWSQADVAARIGSDPKTIGRWERGLTFPGPYLCQQLSDLYKKSPQELGLVANDKLLVAEPAENKDNNTVDEMRVTPEHFQQEVNREGTKYATFVVPPAGKSKLQLFFTSHGWLKLKKPVLFCSLGIVLLLLIAPNAWYFLGRTGVKTAQSPLNPYTGRGTLVLQESLQKNTASKWLLSNNDEGQCFFSNGAYHIRAIKSGGYMKLCLAGGTYFNDFTYEVQMQVMAGDCGGLGFRTTFPQLYYLLICQDGNYRFVRYDRDTIANRRILVSGVSSLIRRGLNQVNVLAVVAKGDTFTVYINHQQLYHGLDEAYLDGQIALLAHPCSIVYLTSTPDVCAVPVEVAFHDIKVWNT